MNCEKGDLAIIVESAAGNEGKIVRCLELDMECGQWIPGGLSEECPIWITDTMLPDFGGTMGVRVADYQLRPLRDKPGEDETLQWLDVPSTTRVTA
jgi:hypothetical protein